MCSRLVGASDRCGPVSWLHQHMPLQLQRHRRAPARRQLLLAHPDGAVHEGACGEHHRGGAKAHAKVRLEACDLVVRPKSQIHRHALPQVQIVCALEHLAHLLAVLKLVRLRAQRPDRWPLHRRQRYTTWHLITSAVEQSGHEARE